LLGLVSTTAVELVAECAADVPGADAPVDVEPGGITVTVRVSLVVVVLRARVELGAAVKVLGAELLYRLVDLREDAGDLLDDGMQTVGVDFSAIVVFFAEDMACVEDLTEVERYVTVVTVAVSVTHAVVHIVDVTVLRILLYPAEHEIETVLLPQRYGGGVQEESGVAVEYWLALDLVTTRVFVAVLVRTFVNVTDFVVLSGGVTTGG
jgi:hypothetical protein